MTAWDPARDYRREKVAVKLRARQSGEDHFAHEVRAKSRFLASGHLGPIVGRNATRQKRGMAHSNSTPIPICDHGVRQ